MTSSDPEGRDAKGHILTADFRNTLALFDLERPISAW